MDYCGPKPYLLHPRHLYRRLKYRQRRSNLIQDTVNQVLAAFELTLTHSPYLPSNQGRSENLLLDTTAGKKLLKQYKPTVPQPAIVYEHSILNYLAEVDFAAPRLLKTKNGQTWISDQGKYYAVFDFIEGGFHYHKYILLPGQTKRFVHTAGQLLAKLHQILVDFEPEGYNDNGFKSKEGPRWRELSWFIDKLKECAARDTAQPTQARSRLAVLSQHADIMEKTLVRLDAQLAAANLYRQVIHGDYGPNNLLFRPGAPITMLDFEIARLDWRATDIVDSLWRFGEVSGLNLRVKPMRWFLQGYQSDWPIPPQELHLLPLVWEFLHLRRCIVNWHHYITTHTAARLHKAIWHWQHSSWLAKSHHSELWPI